MNFLFPKSLLNRLSNLGYAPDDSEDVRLQKSLMVAGSFMFIAAGAAWGVAYIVLGEPVAGMIPLSYSVVSFLSFVFFALTPRYHFYRSSQLVLILLLPFFLQVALGGYVNASAVVFWSFISPLGALLFAEPRYAPRWLVAYLSLLLFSGLLQPYVRASNHLQQNLIIVFYILNLGAVSSIAFVLLSDFIRQKNEAMQLLRQEQERSESLLLNVLPKEAAVRLKSGAKTIADTYDSASILFADLVGFTPLSAVLSPAAMVEVLNEIYSHFDSLVEKYGLEKIRTIGDNYLVASGLPQRRPDHAQALARMALDAIAYLESFPPVGDQRLSFRIGINSGSVIAGVIGIKKFHYDIWGDAVNIASRMESQGEPGKIQIAPNTYELIKNEFICEPQGPITVKGKGLMETWYLRGLKVAG
jgi:guanylate cyclase